MDSLAEIQVSKLGIKARSKKEVYSLLWNEGDVCLPPIEDARHRFISQMLVGDKRYSSVLRSKLQCSSGERTQVEHLVRFAEQHIDIKHACRTMSITNCQIVNGCQTY